jgi:predicted O-methyltransferase YrrM
MICRTINKLSNLIDRIKHAHYDLNFYQKDQKRLYKKIGLERDRAISLVKELRNTYPFLNTSMKSEHQVLFSAISLNKKIKVNKILEIGTYDGANTFLLSQLFPKAKIHTIDLDEKDNDFKKSYDRSSKDKFDKFIKLRSKNLKKSKNIFFEKKNSINLTLSKANYDLIWIDGAHGYPVVPIDISNSIRILNKNGIVVCDDVYIFANKMDPMYISTATLETIKIYKKEKIIDYSLIYKRLDKENNYHPQKRKFLAYLKKIN